MVKWLLWGVQTTRTALCWEEWKKCWMVELKFIGLWGVIQTLYHTKTYSHTHIHFTSSMRLPSGLASDINFFLLNSMKLNCGNENTVKWPWKEFEKGHEKNVKRPLKKWNGYEYSMQAKFIGNSWKLTQCNLMSFSYNFHDTYTYIYLVLLIRMKNLWKIHGCSMNYA